VTIEARRRRVADLIAGAPQETGPSGRDPVRPA
jgi:hypothetical protein